MLPKVDLIWSLLEHDVCYKYTLNIIVVQCLLMSFLNISKNIMNQEYDLELKQ